MMSVLGIDRPSLLVLGLLMGTVVFVQPVALHAQKSGPSTEPFDLYEQSPRYVTKTWSVDDGLPLNVVRAIEQTADGMLWVGTSDGLARFDGHSFTTVTAADTDGLAGNRIFGLYEDRGGTLWIGTSTGVSTYRNGTFRAVDGVAGQIENVGGGPAGTVWMAGKSGIFRAQAGGERATSLSLPDSVDGREVEAAGRDSAWIASGDQLFLYHDGTVQSPDAINARITGAVRALATAPGGRLWVATESEVVSASDNEIKRYPEAGGEINTMHVAPSGALWLTTRRSGLLRITDGGVQRVQVAGSPENRLRGLTRDEHGQWWVGVGGGVGLVRLRSRLFWSATGMLPERTGALSVYADQEGAVWASVPIYDSPSKRVYRFTDTTKTRWSTEEGAPWEDAARAIGEDETGRMWAGTENSLFRQRDNRFAEVQTPTGESFGGVYALERDSTGTLWIASWQQGLYRYRSDTLRRVLPSDSLFNSRVIGLMRAQDGALWIGTQQHGVARWTGGTLTWYDGDDGVPYKSVRDIYQTDDGTIWISTSGGGIARFEGDHFTPVTPEDGLPHRSIDTIREVPKGIFWMTSNGGVFRVPRSQVEAVADGRQDRLYAQTFDTEDGMPNRECNGPFHPVIGIDDQDRLWVPTVHGLAVVDTRSPQLTVPDSMPVQVTAIRVDGQSRPLDSLRFAPDTYRLAFDFTAVSLRHADDLSFRYRLDGEAWTPAQGRRTAEFTNLGAGTHRFEVQATIDGETWYTLKAPLRFTVTPHFYQTWWFRLLVVLAFLGVVLGAYRWRTVRLRRRKKKLETAVAERTRELAEEKKKTERQAEQLAELDEAKNRFFAHVSHEFRTPLSLILSPLEEKLRRDQDLVSFGQQQVRRMADNARRLQRLIDQLLDLATLEAGQMNLDRQPGDLASVVTRAAEAFRSKTDQKEIELRVEQPEGRIETCFDPEKVETVVSNLVGNAVKFTPDCGAVTVRVEERATTASVEAPGEGESARGTAQLAVSDTGPGIDPEAQQQIFDRFEQADNSLTRGHEGTGLGLALTSELVELHGGTIDVESAPGEGATFIVRLPLVPVASTSVEEDEHGHLTAGGDGRVSELGDPGIGARESSVGTECEWAEEAGEEPATILVVEDNAEMRAYLRETLGERWAVLDASDGADGWNVVQEERPDLVVSDVMMPEVDGFELCRQIKGDEVLRTIPVLLLTARADEEATLEGLESGADDYVAKPFGPEELQQRIENHLAARRHLETRYQEEVRLAPFGATVEEDEVPFVEAVTEVIESHVGNPDFSVEQLAEEMALSRRQLSRRLKDAVEANPSTVLRRCRIERAKALFKAGAETVSEVAYAVGYRSPSHFSQVFQEEVGISPSSYREEAEA